MYAKIKLVKNRSILTQFTVLFQFRLTINDQEGLRLLYQELYRLGVFQNEDFDIGDPDDPDMPSKQRCTYGHWLAAYGIHLLLCFC